MERKCPRCRRFAKAVARFCPRCGLSLDAVKDSSLTAGRIRHPSALPAPAGFRSCMDAVDLHFHWESASGGPCLGAESLAVHLFNAGYPLADAVIRLVGHDERGDAVFDLEHIVPDLPQGRAVRIEVPSYEVSRAVTRLDATLRSAEFEWSG